MKSLVEVQADHPRNNANGAGYLRATETTTSAPTWAEEVICATVALVHYILPCPENSFIQPQVMDQTARFSILWYGETCLSKVLGLPVMQHRHHHVLSSLSTVLGMLKLHLKIDAQTFPDISYDGLE